MPECVAQGGRGEPMVTRSERAPGKAWEARGQSVCQSTGSRVTERMEKEPREGRSWRGKTRRTGEGSLTALNRP